MGDIVSCSCGTKNRLPDNWRGVPKCGKCGRVLSVEQETVDAKFIEVHLGSTRQRRQFRLPGWSKAVIAIGLIAGVIFAYNNPWFDPPRTLDELNDWFPLASSSATHPVPPGSKPNSSNDGDLVTVPAGAAPQTLSLDELNTMLAAEAKPKTFEETHKPVKQKPGLVFTKKKPHKGSTLTIKTKPGTNYYVQLNTAGAKTAIQGIYVIGGKAVTVDVPIGVYDIVYATGDTWYGRQHKFGSNAPLYKTDHTFDYRLDADGSIPYYEIELIQQVGGNMETERIDPAEFGE